MKRGGVIMEASTIFRRLNDLHKPLRSRESEQHTYSIKSDLNE
ncbi:MAG TPA: hypothetical protein VJK05_04350 [archaeon]|nr:hypothetical protein [archaeon]